MKQPRFLPAVAALAALTLLPATVRAQVPGVVQYQGRLSDNNVSFNGTGQFKFVLIEQVIVGQSVWSNDGTSVNGSEPAAAVSVPVKDGLFSVALGDNALANMVPIPASAFGYADVRLRIWFSNGQGPFQQLSPDQKITSVPFAIVAGEVPDSAITANKISDGAITGSKMAANTVTSGELANDIALNQLSIGGPGSDGHLKLFADGSGKLTGQLKGDGNGSQLDMMFANSTTGAVFSARPPGGRLQLWDIFQLPTVEAGSWNTGGGELRLFQISGNKGIEMIGDTGVYPGPSKGGAIHVKNSGGTVSTVELTGAATQTTGGRLSLRQFSNVETVVLDGENGPNSGGRIDVRSNTGASVIDLRANGGDVSLAGGGNVQIGSTTGVNLVMDNNEIMVRNNGAATAMYLNYGSGTVYTTRLAVNTTSFVNGYSLNVDGKIICEELVVQDSADWPDYVFADDYQLRPLEEVEASIKKHKHLPGIPSAAEVGDEGISLGQMQKSMMEKIEELTLYVIEQDKRLKAQEAELKALRAQLK